MTANNDRFYPRISIITPSFNQGQFIEQTIESVVGQNYPNLEYIIIDGGSTDSTLSVLKRYEDQIHWTSEKDRGQADAINKGIEKATGDIIAFINSDDCYMPGVFQQVVDVFSARSDIHWITGSYEIIDQFGQLIQPFTVHYKNFLQKFSSPTVLQFTNYIVQPSTFWKRDIHNRIGYFDISLRYTFDYDFWMRMIHYSPLYCIQKPISAFRIHPNSKGGKEYKAQFDEELEVLKRYNSRKLVYTIHKLHNIIIVGIYRILKCHSKKEK